MQSAMEICFSCIMKERDIKIRHVKSVLKRELDIDVDVDSELCEGCVYGKAHRQ